MYAVKKYSVDELISLAQKAILKAAKFLVTVAENNLEFTSQRKQDSSWLLSLDLECEKVLSTYLSAYLPIVSEESEASHSLCSVYDSYFLIDPIDGTSACRRYINQIDGQVGFGPLIGIVHSGALQASLFAHIPMRKLFVAQRGKGITVIPFASTSDKVTTLATGFSLDKVIKNLSLSECVALFFLGKDEEALIVNNLKFAGLIDTGYRYGGFANDCCRLALGYEELQIQLSVKTWDFPASLFCHEAGLEVIFDPLDRAIPFSKWKIEKNNPMITCQKGQGKDFIEAIRKVL
jgi:fructose-1,6-bisphosphatase/inositol monophosphatase family enzyme